MRRFIKQTYCRGNYLYTGWAKIQSAPVGSTAEDRVSHRNSACLSDPHGHVWEMMHDVGSTRSHSKYTALTAKISAASDPKACDKGHVCHLNSLCMKLPHFHQSTAPILHRCRGKFRSPCTYLYLRESLGVCKGIICFEYTRSGACNRRNRSILCDGVSESC
jgi:hypothetical protein